MIRQTLELTMMVAIGSTAIALLAVAAVAL